MSTKQSLHNNNNKAAQELAGFVRHFSATMMMVERVMLIHADLRADLRLTSTDRERRQRDRVRSGSAVQPVTASEGRPSNFNSVLGKLGSGRDSDGRRVGIEGEEEDAFLGPIIVT